MPITESFLIEQGNTVQIEAIIGDCLKEILTSPVIEVSGRNYTITIDISNSFEKNVELNYSGDYIESGREYISPKLKIAAGTRDGCIFTSIPDIENSSDASGILVYKISAFSANRTQFEYSYIVIMWMIPSNNISSNFYAIGMKDNIDLDEINRDLFQEMYCGKETWFQRKNTMDIMHCEITIGGISMLASMNGGYNPYMKVDIRPSLSICQSLE